MGDTSINCPLCCNETFSSKKKLKEHLANVLSNLICPICKDKWTTLVHLIEHLSLDNCHQTNPAQVINEKFGVVTENNIQSKEKTDLQTEQCKEKVQKEILNGQLTSNSKVYTHQKRMYVEIVNDQILKQNPQAHENQLKLIKDSGDRYMILTDDNSILNTSSTVVQQNNDGTITMTVDDSTTNQCEDNNTGLYSCNTCGVFFSSVMEHIQNYHNDQEVVVEDPLGSGNDGTIECETIDSQGLTISDPQASHRMITDNGDIVEATVILETNSEGNQQMMVSGQSIIIPLKPNEVQNNIAQTTSYITVDNINENKVAKNLKPVGKSAPYHKVVMKDLQTTMGNKVKVYKCTSCNICVSALSEFKSHPCKVLKYSCLQCPVAYENPKSLYAHMKVHKPKPEEVNIQSPLSFECGVCSTVFLSSKSLKLHKRMHDPIKSRPIEPPVETTEGTVSEDKYICAICFKLIPEDYRTIHENSHRNPSNTMNCDICNKKFHSKEYLKMHMNVHNMDKVIVGKQDRSLPYTCLYCNRKFARPHEKVKHERIHTGEKPHSCEICGKAFRVSYCLTLHMRTHTGARPYACPHCNKRFKAHSVYNHHLLTHSEVRAYKCPICPKAFKTSVQLAGHKNSHTKPFSCQQCNRPFASLYAVRVHTEIHSRQNSLKFSCSLCGASYARAFALKDHIKQAHKDAVDTMNDVKDWSTREANADGDEDNDEDRVADVSSLNKDLPVEITDLETNSNEMIIS